MTSHRLTAHPEPVRYPRKPMTPAPTTDRSQQVGYRERIADYFQPTTKTRSAVAACRTSGSVWSPTWTPGFASLKLAPMVFGCRRALCAGDTGGRLRVGDSADRDQIGAYRRAERRSACSALPSIGSPDCRRRGHFFGQFMEINT